MAPRAVEERLSDIREAAVDLRDLVSDIETDAFHALPHANRMAYRAVKNALTELGEAIKAMPEDVLKRYPEVGWKGFAGLRDMVVHQYFGIDTRKLLPIINGEVPQLLAAVDAELQGFHPDEPPAPSDPGRKRG
jgi:uncharacterized protein with HEPN domain